MFHQAARRLFASPSRILAGFQWVLVKEVVAIALHQVAMASKDEQVFGVFSFRLIGEVETACDYHFLIDKHDLVMGDSVIGVNERIKPLLEENVQVGVFLDFIAAIEE